MPSCCTRSVPYVPDLNSYRLHYRQKGGALPVFRGLAHQEGYGVGGNIFSSIFRAALPVLKNVVAPALKKTAKAAGKALLKTGTNVLSDVISGEKDFKTAVKQRGIEGLQEVGSNVKKQVVKGARRVFIDDGQIAVSRKKNQNNRKRALMDEGQIAGPRKKRQKSQVKKPQRRVHQKGGQGEGFFANKEYSYY